MGIFSKESCAVCMGKTGLLTRAKLKDGYLCGACNGEVSPYFKKRSLASAGEVKYHLIHRRRNEIALRSFVPTEIVSAEAVTFCLDEKERSFLLAKNRDFRKGNPDIFSLDEVKDCAVQVAKYEHDEYQGPESPVACITTYSYDIYFAVQFRGTWLDEVKVKLHYSSIKSDDDYDDALTRGNAMRDILLEACRK